MQNNQMNPLEQGAPWLANYGDVPFHLEYPNVSIADAVLKTAEKEKDFPAISFMGKTFSYTVLVEKINQAAAGFVALGVKKGDMVTICMPNVPQAVFCMYALNRIGAVASMIHPLSTAPIRLSAYMQNTACGTFGMQIVTISPFFTPRATNPAAA